MRLKLMVISPGISIVFIAASATAQSSPPAPNTIACSVPYVGSEINNPFTARHVTQSTDESGVATGRMPEILEIVARDSAGRVRVEKHGAVPDGSDSVVLHTVGGSQINTTHAELTAITMIFDCAHGKMITLQPGMKIAHVDDGRAIQLGSRSEHTYSFFFTSTLRHNPTADVLAEDLGHKAIEGIDVLGVKTTQIGSDEDEWKGKPIRVFEKWVSDDLAATLVETVIDFKRKMETTSRLVDVNRVEPDASLFEVPAGYIINPTPAEMPFQVGAGKSIQAQPKP